jgi:ferredoxin/flavodoxin---NADP+ reductase
MNLNLKLDVRLKIKRPFILQDRFFVSPSTFVMRFSRNGIQFRAGNFLVVGVLGNPERRKYSIYSAENDNFFEILVKVVEGGVVSNELKNLAVGEKLNVFGPKGRFGPLKEDISSTKYLFISTGTGISPFRSIIASNLGISYTLLHGIRTLEEAYGREYIPEDRYITCISRENTGVFHGRVTDYLRDMEVSKDTECYICGNREMIDEVIEILQAKGLPIEKIFKEVYF